MPAVDMEKDRMAEYGTETKRTRFPDMPFLSRATTRWLVRA